MTSAGQTRKFSSTRRGNYLNELLTFDGGVFSNVRIVKDGGCKWYVANDICDALGIKRGRNAMARLDDDEHTTVTVETSGGKQKVNAVSEAGVYRLILGSRKEFSQKYQRWIAHDVLPTISRDGRYELRLNERIDGLERMLKESGIVKPYINPSYTFENLKTRFIAAVPGSRARDFYDALGEWYGIRVPYARNLHITVKDWLLQHIPLEVMQEFVVGVETHTIVRSRAGYWVSLNGVFTNDTEWERTKHEFDDACAYCGAKDTPLIAEHVIAKSELSKKAPGRVDLVENIVPTCARCNGSKETNPWKPWYKKQKFFDNKRLHRIENHINKYHIEGKR